jgi:hypothetical protein
MTWQAEAISMHRAGEPADRIARVLGVTRDRVCRLVDPTYAERRAAQVRASREFKHRSDRPRPPEILPTERTVVRELWDGTRVSLPRVRWLERPMPESRP